jgi:hypothetical protein
MEKRRNRSSSIAARIGRFEKSRATKSRIDGNRCARAGARRWLWLWLCLAFAGLALAVAYADFLAALAARESSNRQTKVNRYGYAGLFQMGEAALIDAGYYRRDGTQANDWRGNWTGKDGVNGLQDFLNDRQAQVNAVTRYHDIEWSAIRRLGLDDKYAGKTVNGVVVTASGLLAAAHLLGVGGLAACLRGGNCTDANQTTAFSYMKQFGGYDISNITGGAAAPPDAGGGGPAPNPAGGGGHAAAPPLLPSASRQPLSANDAFLGGSGVDFANVKHAVSEIVSIAMLLWTAWVTQAQYLSWRRGKVEWFAMQGNIVKSAALTMLVLAITLI